MHSHSFTGLITLDIVFNIFSIALSRIDESKVPLSTASIICFVLLSEFGNSKSNPACNEFIIEFTAYKSDKTNRQNSIYS